MKGPPYEGVEPFAGNMKNNSHVEYGEPVFPVGVRNFYVDWKRQLDESKPPL